MRNLFRSLTKASRRARKATAIARNAQKILFPFLTQAAPARKPHKAKVRRVTLKPTRTKPILSSFVDGSFGKLDYKLYSPGGRSGKQLPLVVMLHGCKQSAADFAAGTGMNKVADECGFLVLYPQQSLSANLARCWNWHRPDNQRRGRGEPAAIAALTRHVIKVFSADASRVYIAGISAGGSAASIIGSLYPELYAAVGVHSGVPRGDVTTLRAAMSGMRSGSHTVDPGNLARPRPTIVFHGDRDNVVHPSNATGFLTDLDQSDPGALVAFTQTGTTGGRDFVRTRYRRGAGAVLLERWEVHGSGHAWSGGSSAGSFSDPAGPSASRQMARFFLEQKPKAAASKATRLDTERAVDRLRAAASPR